MGPGAKWAQGPSRPRPKWAQGPSGPGPKWAPGPSGPIRHVSGDHNWIWIWIYPVCDDLPYPVRKEGDIRPPYMGHQSDHGIIYPFIYGYAVIP